MADMWSPEQDELLSEESRAIVRRLRHLRTGKVGVLYALNGDVIPEGVTAARLLALETRADDLEAQLTRAVEYFRNIARSDPEDSPRDMAREAIQFLEPMCTHQAETEDGIPAGVGLVLELYPRTDDAREETAHADDHLIQAAIGRAGKSNSALGQDAREAYERLREFVRRLLSRVEHRSAADEVAGDRGLAWIPVADSADLKRCPSCGELALEGQVEAAFREGFAAGYESGMDDAHYLPPEGEGVEDAWTESDARDRLQAPEAGDG